MVNINIGDLVFCTGDHTWLEVVDLADDGVLRGQRLMRRQRGAFMRLDEFTTTDVSLVIDYSPKGTIPIVG